MLHPLAAYIGLGALTGADNSFLCVWAVPS